MNRDVLFGRHPLKLTRRLWRSPRTPEQNNSMYTLEKTVGGKRLRVTLSDSLEWSGDEPLLAVCRDVHRVFFSARGELRSCDPADIAPAVAKAIKCEVAPSTNPGV